MISLTNSTMPSAKLIVILLNRDSAMLNHCRSCVNDAACVEIAHAETLINFNYLESDSYLSYS